MSADAWTLRGESGLRCQPAGFHVFDGAALTCLCGQETRSSVFPWEPRADSSAFHFRQHVVKALERLERQGSDFLCILNRLTDQGDAIMSAETDLKAEVEQVKADFAGAVSAISTETAKIADLTAKLDALGVAGADAVPAADVAAITADLKASSASLEALLASAASASAPAAAPAAPAVQAAAAEPAPEPAAPTPPPPGVAV